MRPVLLIVAVGNVVAMGIFLFLLFLLPLYTDVKGRGNFVELDREDVINVDALKKFHPSRGFVSSDPMVHRITVPRYIAGPALLAERRNAALGVAVTAFNSLIAGGAWLLQTWQLRRARRNATEKK